MKSRICVFFALDPSPTLKDKHPLLKPRSLMDVKLNWEFQLLNRTLFNLTVNPKHSQTLTNCSTKCLTGT
ncbi:hypothetical protein ACSBR2_034921 [Camellia fascicularis]